MLKTIIFSFSHNVFYLSQDKFQFLSQSILLCASALNLDQSKDLSFGKGLKELQESLDRCTVQNSVKHHIINKSTFSVETKEECSGTWSTDNYTD